MSFLHSYYYSNSLFMFFFTLRILTTEAQQSQPLPPLLCYRDNNYTQGSPYESNLKFILTSLASNITPNGFYMATSGTSPNTVYGLLQCRSGVSNEDCQSCANTSTTEIVKQCPFNKEAVMYYENCILHYGNTKFFGIVDARDDFIRLFSINASNQVVFGNQLDNLLDKLSATAASDPRRFSSGANFSEYDIYGMVQCTRDLSEDSCLICLKMVRSIILKEKVGGRYFCPSCFIRYEISSFSGISIVSPPSPPAPSTTVISPPPTTTTDGNSTNRTTTNQGMGNENHQRNIILATVIPTVIASFLGVTTCLFLLRRKQRRKKRPGFEEVDIQNINILTFSLNALRVCTKNFSESNKLGEGGFGSVYKGKLPDGREIAVKRLSKKSRQGLKELKTEVEFVAKLQHKNLVRLLGFCLEEEEMLLVYENLPNGSLDKILFDERKRLLLDWDKRYNIIEGIARGLQYLHQDSQIRIIHRDLKASNILLDKDMIPKISDFGLARLFLESHIQRNTERIAGTYGYMAPEYVNHGELSIKSDVFSYGVIVLEIVMGRKNSSFHDFGNLVRYAWQHWKDGTSIELVDPILGEKLERTDILKCIQIGLLCVQQDADVRPTMSKVIFLLNSHNTHCPLPSIPAYFVKRAATNLDKTSESSSVTIPSKFSQQSMNEVTITDMDPR